MDWSAFARRFAADQEIGRDVTDTQFRVFFDDGRRVGVWRMDRANTLGRGEIVSAAEAEAARSWCRLERQKRDRRGPAR